MKYKVETLDIRYLIDMGSTELNEGIDVETYKDTLPQHLEFELEADDLIALDDLVVEAVKQKTGHLGLVTYKIVDKQ